MFRTVGRSVRPLAAVLALMGSAEAARAQLRSGGPEEAPALSLVFPTDNEALAEGEPARFYMGLDRLIAGERAWAWEGGTYGYCRNARETPAGWRFTRYHEGIDIAPLYRDEDGEPLDEVRTVDAGRVVYVNRSPGGSDYGRYVVVEHVWDGSRFYSLYAHLASTAVYEGDRVRRGETLGVLGYSGDGLDRDRAHLHFEVNLLLSEHFGAWRDARHPRWPDTHGRFHGYNLAGVSPADLLMRSRRGSLSVANLFTGEQADVTVYAPSGPPPELLARYPFLCRSCDGAEPPAWAQSWEVGFTRGGLPVRVEPSERRVGALRLGRVEGIVTADYLESRLLTTRGSGADLNAAGRALLALLFTRPGAVPEW